MWAGKLEQSLQSLQSLASTGWRAHRPCPPQVPASFPHTEFRQESRGRGQAGTQVALDPQSPPMHLNKEGPAMAPRPADVKARRCCDSGGGICSLQAAAWASSCRPCGAPAPQPCCTVPRAPGDRPGDQRTETDTAVSRLSDTPVLNETGHGSQTAMRIDT